MPSVEPTTDNLRPDMLAALFAEDYHQDEPDRPADRYLLKAGAERDLLTRIADIAIESIGLARTPDVLPYAAALAALVYDLLELVEEDLATGLAHPAHLDYLRRLDARSRLDE